MGRTFKTGFRITGDAKGAINATRATRKELDKLNKAQLAGNGIAKRFARNLLSGRSAMIAFGTAAAGMAGVVNEAVKFEKSMAEVSTLLDNTDGIDNLTVSVRELSQEFGKAPVEQAKALYQIISAGAGTAAEQMSLLTASNKLAIGGVTEVNIAADALTTILNAYSLEASAATDISDLLFVGMKQGKTTIEDMGLAIGQVATIAAQTGVGIDELIAGVATLTKSGIKTTEAMSGLRGVLAAVLKQSPQSVAMAKDMGVAFSASALKAKGLAKFLDDIQIAAEGDSEKLQKLFGRVEGLTAVMSLGANGAKEYNTILAETANRAGATDEAFARMAETTAFQLDQLKASIQVLATVLGETLLPAVNDFASALIRIIQPVMDLETATMNAATASRNLGSALRANAFDEYQKGIDDASAKHVELDAQITRLREKLLLIEPTYHKGHAVVEALKDEISDLAAQQHILVKGIVAAKGRLAEYNQFTEITVTAQRKFITVTKLSAAAIAAQKREIDAAATSLQTLADRLDPLAALERQFSVESSILVGKINEGGDGAERYTELLRLLAIEFGENSTAMAGMGEKTEVVTQKMAKSFDTFGDAVRRGVERMDDLFADLWKGIFSGGTSALDSLKSFFTNWLAEMAHAAITRPIVVSMTTAMSGGAAASSGASSQSGALSALLGAGGLGSVLAGALGGGAFGSLFGENEAIGGAIGGAAGGLLLGGVGGSLFGSFAASGLGTAIAGSMGASSFIALGSVIAPVIGTAIGALVGVLLGSFVGERSPRISAGGTAGAVSNKARRSQFHDSALGGFFIGNAAGGQEEFKAAAVDAIQQFDSVIAGLLDGDALEKIDSALDGWAVTLKKDAVTIENLLDSRWRVILSTLPDDIRGYVEGFDGIEEQVERLGLAAGAQRIIDAAPDLFEGRTFQEFISVAEAMQAEGEDLTQTFNRLVEQMAAISQAYTVIKAIGESNIADDFQALMDAQSMTLLDVLGNYRTELAELADGFDGSAESVARLAALSSNLYESELAFMLQIEQVRQGVSAGFGNLREQIERDLFGDDTFYNKIKDRAEDLAEALQTMTDPAEIAATVAEIQRLSGNAYGLLNEDQRSLMGADFLTFMDQVEADALARLGLAESGLVAGSSIDHALISELAAGLGDPLAIAASAHIGAAEALTAAAAELADAANDIRDAVGAPPPEITNPGTGYGSGEIGITEPPSQIQSNNDVADAIAAAVAGAVSGASQDTVTAIRSALSSLQININIPSAGLVNE